jgi:hypothetical protein
VNQTTPTRTAVLDCLTRAREIIQTGWTPMGIATDCGDLQIGADSPGAEKWSVFGAVFKAAKEDLTVPTTHYQTVLVNRAMKHLHRAACESDGFIWESLHAWSMNEGRTQEQAVNLFNRAVQAARR